MGYNADDSSDPQPPSTAGSDSGNSASVNRPVRDTGSLGAASAAHGGQPAVASNEASRDEVAGSPLVAGAPPVAGEPPVAGPQQGSGGAGGNRPKRSGTWSALELPILIAIAIAIAIVLKTFVVQPFYIPSESMERTLHGCPGCTGDRILVFKPVFKARDPHPGDVVVFRAPQDWDELAGVQLSSNPVVHGIQWFGQLVGVVPPSEKDLVKRVIAIGGQTVRCCDDNGNVQVSDHGDNGPWRSLNEPYIYQNSSWSKPSSPADKAADDSRSFGPVTVPAGRLWVMGDHRSDSADSRYHCGDAGSGANCDPVSSTVPKNDVIGKAVVIAWPPSRWRTLGTPKTFSSLGLPGLGALPSEPAAAALLGVAGLGGWRRRRRRR
jgi:signal peptidase I